MVLAPVISAFFSAMDFQVANGRPEVGKADADALYAWFCNRLPQKLVTDNGNDNTDNDNREWQYNNTMSALEEYRRLIQVRLSSQTVSSDHTQLLRELACCLLGT